VTNQSSLRTDLIERNDNKSIAIGTIRAVRIYSERLGLRQALAPFKSKGVELHKLIEALVAYKLVENFSIEGCGRWLENKDVRAAFGLPETSARTLNRAVEIIGEHLQGILLQLRRRVMSLYKLEHTDVNIDTSSVSVYGLESPLGAYGYSREHRPDLQQVMFGVVELRDPVNIPIHLTVGKGNLADQVHFLRLVGEVIDDLRASSTLIFDAGGDNKQVTDLITSKGHGYVTRKKLNASDEEWLRRMRHEELEMVTEEVCCAKHRFGSGRCIYLFYSAQLFNDKLRTIDSIARKKVRDALEFISMRKDGRISISKAVVKKVNPLFDVEVSVQTKLLGDEQAMLDFVKQRLTKGTEGFFKLESSKDLTAIAAYRIYREKDTVEKLIESLKNHVEIKPLRCWNEDSVKGILLVGFIAQMMISMIRYEHPELRDRSTKFIIRALEKLTATYFLDEKGRKSVLYSNFDLMNCLILDEIILEG
jgi:transposase